MGIRGPYYAASIQSHFAYVDDHPIVDAYHHYLEMPYDRSSWDLPSVLYAVRPDEGYLTCPRPVTSRCWMTGASATRRAPAACITT